jgi:tetratricopeptide (TPR) repeat protein
MSFGDNDELQDGAGVWYTIPFNGEPAVKLLLAEKRPERQGVIIFWKGEANPRHIESFLEDRDGWAIKTITDLANSEPAVTTRRDLGIGGARFPEGRVFIEVELSTGHSFQLWADGKDARHGLTHEIGLSMSPVLTFTSEMQSKFRELAAKTTDCLHVTEYDIDVLAQILNIKIANLYRLDPPKRLPATPYLIDKLTPQNTLAARRELEKAVALDPNSAEAWARLAHLSMTDYLRGWNSATEANIGEAEQYLQKAYAIDRSVALAHVAKGKIREAKGDLPGEIDALNEALQLDPNLAVAYAHKANALILLGRAQEAPELLRKAVQLSPRDPDLGLFYWFMGRAYFNMKNYTDAIQWLKKSVQESPTTWFSWAHLISAYALTGQLQQPDANADLDEYRQRFKADWPLEPNIKEYYNQAKYRSAPPELQAALQEYFSGLQIAKEIVGFP